MELVIALSVVAIGLAVSIYVARRVRDKKHAAGRVAIPAVIVDYTPNQGISGPPRATFEYALPDGRWHRNTHTVFLNPVPGKKLFSKVVPGEVFTVYMNPKNPDDVYLGDQFDITSTRIWCFYLLTGIFLVNAAGLYITALA